MLGGAAIAAMLLRNGDMIQPPVASRSRMSTRSNFGQMGERRFATA
jgi:hypothetical protein